ncbi:MAG TPA: response regulator [Nitrospirales bacterium]|nr:response regulator [Nitrospirales bacterium]
MTAATTAATVLVVDDDFSIRAIMARELEARGYRVLQAGESDEALKLCDSEAAIDVLVTDVLLPSKMKMADKTQKTPPMNGVALMRRIQQSRPTIKVILISGQSETLINSLGVLKQGVSFLRKPFNPDTLFRAVRDVLAQA